MNGEQASVPPLFIVVLHKSAHAVILHVIFRCGVEAAHVVVGGGAGGTRGTR